MIDLEKPIWLDDGVYLIDRNVKLRNTDMVGPGVLKIVCDSAYIKDMTNFITQECAITMYDAHANYSVNLKFAVEFYASDSTKPRYPMRFTGLRRSVVDLQFQAWGSGDSADMNAPDFYHDNQDVRIRGTYKLHQATPGVSTGGLWVREVPLGSAPWESYGVVVEDGTVIEGDGIDEPLAFFNPGSAGNWGIMRGCGVGAAHITGRGIGLTFLNFGGNSVKSSDFKCFARNADVTCTNLRKNQAVVKTDYCAPRIDGVTACIAGFEAGAISTDFYSAFREMNARSDADRPVLTSCTAAIDAEAGPGAGYVRGFDAGLIVIDGFTDKRGTQAFTHGAQNCYRIVRGNYSGATTHNVDNVRIVQDALFADFPTNLTFFRGLETHGKTTATTDASGQITITYALNFSPTDISAKVFGNILLDVDIVSASATTMILRVYTKSTGAAYVSASATVTWKVGQ